MFQHALQICTITSVAIVVNADLMLAVNVKDFRYIVNKFLSKDLSEKLTNLVSKVSLTRKPDVRPRADKEKFINDKRHPSQHSNKKVNLNKRFITVRNSNKDLLDCENNSPGPVYVRDELDDILKNINKEYTYNDYATTLANIDDNINSKVIKPIKTPNIAREQIREGKDQSDTHKKIDYTETKLGEWKYNHVELKKPVEIKNIKTGKLDRYFNDQGATDHDEARLYQFPNVKNVQYVYETQLGPQVKNKHIKQDISNNLKQGLIYPGLTNKHTKKVKVYDTQVDKEETFDSYISSTKQKDSPKRKPHNQPIEPTEPNEFYKKQPLRYLNEFSTTKDGRQIFKEPNLGNNYKMYHENISPKQDEMIKFQDVKEINPESKQLNPNNFLNDSVEIKEVREQDTSSKHHLGLNIKIQQIKPSIHPVEVNNMDINYELGSLINNNNDRGFQHKSVEESENKQIRDRKIHNADYENKDEDDGDESNNEELLLRHKKRYLDFKGLRNSEKSPERDQAKGFAAYDRHYLGEDKSETAKSKLQDSFKHREEVGDQSVEGNVKFKKENYIGKKKLRNEPFEENDMYEKFALGSKNEWSRKTKNKQKTEASQPDSKVKLGSKLQKWNFSLHSYEDNGNQENNGKYDLASKNKNTRNRKPLKQIKENEMYKRIALGSENTKYNEIINKQPSKEYDNYDLGSNEETTMTKKPQKSSNENDKYEKMILSSEYKINNRRQTKKPSKDHDKYDQGTTEKPLIKNKPQKLTEEIDMYASYELDHEINEDNRNKQKQKENPDILRTNLGNKNKLNYHGYKDDKTGNNTLILIQNDKQDKHTEVKKKHEESKEDDVTEKAPSEGYADEPRPDFEEVKPESIKAKTESLLDDDVAVNKAKTTKKFTMKGTIMPKRDFYKLSSPNYYKDLPRDVDKYDFEEPIPDRDREREKEDKLKREPATINRKFKLAVLEDT